MRLLYSLRKHVLVFALIGLSAGLCDLRSQGANPRPRRIAVFGSSVANGTGDEFRKEGYTGLLRELLAPMGWEVLNQSRGGDTTKSLATRWAPEGDPAPNTRYLLPVKPSYVVIGLSLANEGILEARTKQEKDAVFTQYAEGIKGFIAKARQNNIVPIIALVYPRMTFTPVEYEYVRRMNLLQNSWDVPSINFLGATDDGNGKYTIGFDYDDKHPNAAGHREFMLSIVPTLFEALEKGKPTPKRQVTGQGFAKLVGGAPLMFMPNNPMHSFAYGVTVRAQDIGNVGMIGGVTLGAETESKTSGQTTFQSSALSVKGSFEARIAIEGGMWSYAGSNGQTIRSEVAADSGWHNLMVSHYAARGETLFYVDGKLAGKVVERLQPTLFVLGSPRSADFKDVFVYRAALNSDEVAALQSGQMLQASLEIYSPLSDGEFGDNIPVENRAQSMTHFIIGGGDVFHVADEPAPTRKP